MSEKESIEEQQDVNDDLFERFVLKVDKGQEPLRIDKFLKARIENATRNKIQQAINAGLVSVNKAIIKQNYKIKPFDEIIVYSDMSPQDTEVVPEKIDFTIVWRWRANKNSGGVAISNQFVSMKNPLSDSETEIKWILSVPKEIIAEFLV